VRDLKCALRAVLLPAKLIGMAALAAHVAAGNARLEPVWILPGVAIPLAVTLVLVPLLSMLTRLRGKAAAREYDRAASKNVRRLARVVARKPSHLLLVPGEDGFFFLPLVYLGITPVSAAAAAGLFALVHLATRTSQACVVLFVAWFLVCLIVLPHGILPVVFGHLVLDTLAYLVMRARQRRKTANGSKGNG